ncbi:MAG: cyclic nucleotide-binding domain-containing protein, partial [Opitutales bacterium]|nr:cyclic nucleotide-binding domain-containing protein [Opitutales bacterium]
FADLLYEDFRYASVRTLFTVLWLTVLSLFVFFTIGEFLPQWWHDIPEEQVLYGLLVIFVWLSVIYPLFIIQRDFISVYRERNQERKRKIKVEKQRSRYRENNPPSPEERKLFFREAPVCRPLDDKDLEVLANKTSFVYHARKEIVFDEAHPDSNLKILYYGKVDVFRQKGRFRKEQLDQLSSGASINKAAKGVEDKAPRKYRCRPKSAFFVAESEKNPELDRVLTKMNSSQVGIYLAFLARTPPFASWSPELLELLASEASVLNFRKGQKVLQTDKANKFFYIVYEGELSFEPENSRKKNNRIFKPGAFFGELSVLRNALPAGNVVGIEAGQCLTVGKSDFIRFMTRFPEAILEMEKVASQTVGFPIFPVSEATSKV